MHLEPIPRPPEAPRLRVGPALLRDLAQVESLYLGQDEAARRMYHPLPFRPWLLRIMLRGLVVAERISRRWVRWAPRASAGFMVGRLRDTDRVVAFGHLRFRRADGGILVAETGYFVDQELRRQGLGTEFKRGLINEARRFGAQRVEALINPENTASVRLNQKLGFRFAPAPVTDQRSPHAQLIVAQLDLEPVPPPSDGSVTAPVDGSRRARV